MSQSKIAAGSSETSRENTRWMSVAIQGLSLLSALVVNFLVPLVYGVEFYGKFIQSNILVFVIQKFADIVIEPLMSWVDPKFLFVTAMLTSCLVLLISQGINYFDSIGSQALLAAMLLSSNCMLSMFSLKLQRQLLLHLLLLLLVFLSLLVCDLFGIVSISLLELLIWSNVVPAIVSFIGLFMKGARIPPFFKMGEAIKTSLCLFPRNVSSTLVFNCLTNIFPYIMAKQMLAYDLGVFRIVTSILQSATSLFPINVKAIFSIFIEGKDRSRQLHALMVASLLYFSIIGISTSILTYFVPKLTPYLEMITILPVIYWVVLLERYMQASKINRSLVVINLVISAFAVVAIFFAKELKHAEYIYALGLAIYAIALLASSQINESCVKGYVVIIFSVLTFMVGSGVPCFSLVYMCLLAMMILVFMRPRLVDFFAIYVK
jgi:hypothetical protein